MIGVANGTLPLEDVRYAGDLVPELAFTFTQAGREVSDLHALITCAMERL